MTLETTSVDRANAAQRAASNPRVSTFVAASAGSGKTKLLTDRLLRLMLAGTPPGRILCLTYTKAAAAEMAIRLNTRLGTWVVLPDPLLNTALTALDVTPNAATLTRARKLFADVLDLPGGIRIETIHAFCQSLLRRFPLEAGLSPHFELADAAASTLRLREARETVLAAPTHRDAILALAAETDEPCFATLIDCLAQDRHDAPGLLRKHSTAAIAAMQSGALAAAEQDHDDMLRAAVQWDRDHHVERVLRRVQEHGNPSGQTWATKGLEWLAHEAENRFLNWVHWVDNHFKKDGDRRTLKGFYGAKLKSEEAELHAEIVGEHTRIEIIEDKRKAAKLRALNSNLIRLAAPILQTERDGKQLDARLSYADLVTYTSQLLVNPGAAWILYKLDGGIDHLLLDEVQDTAPAQWEIAHAIAAEFFAGAGAREEPRSIFAVGDAKQSIFSFQGADLGSFETYRDKFRKLATGAGETWLDGELATSFRSTAPVLQLVDAVFAAGPAQDGVRNPVEELSHGVSRLGQAGTVTLWPLTAAAAAEPAPAWAVPDTYTSTKSAKALLAEQIARHIGETLGAATTLPSRGRAVGPGDFLILVRRRDELSVAITRACKDANIPIAGLDRMVLKDQPAVSDLMALCDALLLPEDDLAFGQYLASPLGGLTDDELMRLALDRRGNLAAALHAHSEDFPEAHAMFETLRNQVDFLTPHALLSEALGALGGRARLLRRFGSEAAEPIDELLAEALAFARREPAALQTFLHQLRQSSETIKREAEAAGDVVRIMTVHGAKGLQAPIVILPDTTTLADPSRTLFWLPAPQQPSVSVPIFCPRTSLRSTAVREAADREKLAERQEYNRLLYVALTRAEDQLIICGAATKTKMNEACWYETVHAGFIRLEARTDATGALVLTTPQTAAPDRKSSVTIATVTPPPAWAGAAPDWRAAPPALETVRPEPLAPSRAADPQTSRTVAASPLGGDFAAARAVRTAALAKGRAVHALLQHLPDLPPPRRAAAARRFLRAAGLDAAAQSAISNAVLQILDDPALAPLFSPGSRAEAPLAGVVDGVEIAGLIDRLGIGAEQVLLADYKTDREPPATAAAIPPGYLRQLAAYRAILGQVFPARPVSCLLIFTETAAAITIPPALLDSHAPARHPLDRPRIGSHLVANERIPIP